MTRTIAVLIGGVLIGIVAMLVIAPGGGPPANEPLRDITDVPRMADAVSERHRLQQYAGINSIEEVIALPSEFAHGEAMFVIAGRSDSARVQKLIFDANRIADDVERNLLLEILFLRLTELDPQSALALAQSDELAGAPSIERAVWRAWARRDLDAALFAAKSQASNAQQRNAAQYLFAAFGFTGNETTDYIAAELGIRPDRATRSSFILLLAAKSIPDTVQYIDGLDRSSEQREAVTTLAYHVTKEDPDSAARIEHLFTNPSNAERFRVTVDSILATQNPRNVIENWLAGGPRTDRDRNSLLNAMRTLTETDIDAALAYYENARSRNERQMFGAMIATEFARQDPLAAIEWARAQGEGRNPILQMSVLAQIALDDPQLAFSEALKSPNASARHNLVSNILQQVAKTDPLGAAAYLEQVQDLDVRETASQHLASVWIGNDPDAAIDWILAQDVDNRAEMLRDSMLILINNDVDAARRVLPRLDAEVQRDLREYIAQYLATARSPGEALEFINQFQGQANFGDLQTAVISGAVNSDPSLARQMADQLADSQDRDRVYAQLVGRQAESDPVEAARWIATIEDDKLRAAAAAEVAIKWHARDPGSAMRWVSEMPAGESRDMAIMQMSYQWDGLTTRQQQLIDSIADQEMRSLVIMRRIYDIAQSDPEKARRLLDGADISASQREQAESVISGKSRGY